MNRTRLWLLVLVAVVLLSGVSLMAYWNNQPVIAQQGGNEDILPTPEPLPPETVAPTPTPPPAPQSDGGLAGPATAVDLLRQDFNANPDVASWEVIDLAEVLTGPSQWQVIDGRLTPVSDFEGLPGFYATALLVGEADLQDYRVAVSAYATGNEEMGVVARASAAGFYVFRYLQQGNQYSGFLARYDPQTRGFDVLARYEGAGFETGRWYVLGLSVKGEQLEATIDGQVVLSARDTSLSAGKAGVYGYAQGGLEFDNLVVQAFPEAQ